MVEAPLESEAASAPVEAPANVSAKLSVTPVRLTPEEGMRFYAAIIGHEPIVDPEAPDLLPHLHDDELPPTNWAGEVSRSLRDELGRKFQMKLHRRPTWRELMETMTVTASRRLEEARRRLQRRDAA